MVRTGCYDSSPWIAKLTQQEANDPFKVGPSEAEPDDLLAKLSDQARAQVHAAKDEAARWERVKMALPSSREGCDDVLNGTMFCEFCFVA